MDEIAYIRGESKTKICITQSLLKNKKVIQNAHSKIYYVNTKMHTNSEIIHPFLYLKWLHWICVTCKQIYISFELLSDKSEKISKTDQISPTKVINVDTYQDNNIKRKITKTPKIMIKASQI